MSHTNKTELLSISTTEQIFGETSTTPYLPPCEHKGLRLSAALSPDRELKLLLSIEDPLGSISIMYPLESFAMVMEFRRALLHPLTPALGHDWDGKHFFVSSAAGHETVYLMGKSNGIMLRITAVQWVQIRELFEVAFERIEYQIEWARLISKHGRK